MTLDDTEKDPRAVVAERMRMARAKARLNQVETAERAQVFLEKLSPSDHLSREIIRKYEDEKAPYPNLADNPARAIAIADALDVDPIWLTPDMPLSPEGVAKLREALIDLVDVWPKQPAAETTKKSKRTTKGRKPV